MARPPVYEGFAAAAPGTEELVEAELRGLGLKGIEKLPGGISFQGSALDIFSVNLHSRVANRVLVRAARFNAGGWKEFERRIARVEWQRWLPPATPVKVRAVAAKTRMNHTGRLEELVLSTIQTALGVANPPPGDTSEPLEVYLRVRREKVTVSIDTSGDHLHRRGYRTHTGEAPLRENLAAACLVSLGYDGSKPLVDPCCGSGTLAVEAALIATETAPGLLRNFAFERLPLFEQQGWQRLLEGAKERRRSAGKMAICGSDIDPQAVALANRAAKAAGVAESVQLSVKAMEELESAELCFSAGGYLVANPPYGLRLKGEARAYKSLAQLLKGPFSAWRWGVMVCRRREAARFTLSGEQGLYFTGAGLPLEFRMGGAPV